MNLSAAGTEATDNAASLKPLRIVGLGASAGGLEPLLQFLQHVPPASGLAFVVVQHLDPTRKAMLGSILQRATPMAVLEVHAPVSVMPDTVYVITPDTELAVRDGMLQVSTPDAARGLRLPIDVLFSSLARAEGARATGVVLSGMGADGTLGLQAIRAQGGFTLAQRPASAEFEGMPASAIAAGAVDVIGLPAELPGHIVAHVRTRADSDAAPPVPDQVDEALATILALLRASSRHDLSLYKPSTLRRRIERRMAIHAISSMPQYVALLQANPAETELLFKEMLIGVTRFFRDGAVWQVLQAEVVPELIAQAAPGTRLRAWVAGCSTGEEAYSLAMVFAEAFDTQPHPDGVTLQIFATDLNPDAVTIARRGFFSAQSLAGVSAERLARFFQPRPGGFVIAPRLREMVLFARHDVNLDPPFTRLDLLSCRNLLIYFSATLQKRLLPLFHYSVRPGGFLLLGESETVGAMQGLFQPVSPQARLYRRSQQSLAISSMHLNFHQRAANPAATPESCPMTTQPPIPPNMQALADQLLQRFLPAAVLVTEQGDIVYVHGRTGAYLEPAAGKANWNVHVMARPELRSALAAAMRQAATDRRPVEMQGLPIEGQAALRLKLTVEPVATAVGQGALLMIIFQEVAVLGGTPGDPAAIASPSDTGTAHALQQAQEEIRRLRAAMRTAEEERQAAIEELQSTNEELQTTNEELTTSKEESQSMNEELQTINAELHSKLDDLALAQSDMHNLLNSTDIATLFLDRELNVRRFTEQVKRIINLRETDIGRPLSDLTTTLDYPDLRRDVGDTLRTLVFSEKEIPTSDGHWFKVRIMPYRTVADVIQGAVITLVDITAAKQLESQLRSG